jgi:hypothetical protein
MLHLTSHDVTIESYFSAALDNAEEQTTKEDAARG